MDRIHSHRRWLRRMEASRAERQRRAAEKEDALDLPALHRSLAIKRRAIPILVAFARELAGMPAGEHAFAVASEQPPPAEGLPAAIEFAPSTDRSSGPTPHPATPKWTKTHRPGPFDVLTWEEAMQVPWIEGSEACDFGSDEG